MDAVDPSLKSTKVDIETLLAERGVSKRIRGRRTKEEAKGRKRWREEERSELVGGREGDRW